MTGALVFMALAAVEAEAAHRRFRVGQPCHRIVADVIVLKFGAGLGLALAYGSGA